ncbi:MAG: MBL fold metallo-hydrolase [Patescibacteria group bacterium]|nr:MBL fold metallo-hydrolase [Patescibacteria group bacterium]
MMKLILKRFTVGPIREHPYLLISSSDAAVIDPGGGVESILEELEKHQARLKYILLTHGHPDHILATGSLKKATGAKIGICQDDLVQLNLDWSKWAGNFPELEISIGQPDFFVKESGKIEFGTIKLEVIYTPGHSPGSVCYYESENKCLFSGDTLFAEGSVGRTDLPGSEPAEMVKSIFKLLKLPSETTIYPGHGISSTIAKETLAHRSFR